MTSPGGDITDNPPNSGSAQRITQSNDCQVCLMSSCHNKLFSSRFTAVLLGLAVFYFHHCNEIFEGNEFKQKPLKFL